MQASTIMRKSPLPRRIPPASRPLGTAKPKVVLVESDPDSRDLLKLVLELDGCCEVLELEDAEQAFQLDGGSHPTALIVNIGYNDLVTIGRLRQHEAFRHLPIIVTSANALPSFQTRALTAGCDLFFTKPYDHDQLLVALKPYLQADRQ